MSTIPLIAFPEEALLPKLRIPTHPVVTYVRVLSRMSVLCIVIVLSVYKYLLNPAFETTLRRRFELHNFVYTRLKAMKKLLEKKVKNPPHINVTYNNKVLIDRTICSDDVLIEEQKQSEYSDFKKNAKRNSNSVRFTIDAGDGTKKDVQLKSEEENEDIKPFSDINEKANMATSNLVNSLQNLKDRMSELNVLEFKYTEGLGYNDGNREMNALLLQVKQFQTYLEVVTSENPRELLFKKPLSQIQVGRKSNGPFRFNYLDILNSTLDEIQQKVHE